MSEVAAPSRHAQMPEGPLPRSHRGAAGHGDHPAQGRLGATQCRGAAYRCPAAVAEKLARTEDRMKFGADQVLAFVDLLERPGELYERVPEGMRRDLLLAFFSKLRVYVESDGLRIESDRTGINATLHSWQAQQRVAAADHVVGKEKGASRISAEGSFTVTSTGLNESNGLSNSNMVGLTGFEPATP